MDGRTDGWATSALVVTALASVGGCDSHSLLTYVTHGSRRALIIRAQVKSLNTSAVALRACLNIFRDFRTWAWVLASSLAQANPWNTLELEICRRLAPSRQLPLPAGADGALFMSVYCYFRIVCPQPRSPPLRWCRAKCRWRAGSDFPLKHQANKLSLCERIALFQLSPTNRPTSVFIKCSALFTEAKQ